jgi:hypothetical protein
MSFREETVGELGKILKVKIELRKYVIDDILWDGKIKKDFEKGNCVGGKLGLQKEMPSKHDWTL